MKIINWLLGVLLVMTMIVVVSWVGPMLETKYFPVYSKFTILDSTPTEKGLRIRAQFTKWRNCDPQGYSWYIGDFGIGMRQLPVISAAPYSTVHRPLGTQVSQPFEVAGITEEDLPQLFAEVYNRCHPLWITRSEIYP